MSLFYFHSTLQEFQFSKKITFLDRFKNILIFRHQAPHIYQTQPGKLLCSFEIFKIIRKSILPHSHLTTAVQVSQVRTNQHHLVATGGLLFDGNQQWQLIFTDYLVLFLFSTSYSLNVNVPVISQTVLSNKPSGDAD